MPDYDIDLTLDSFMIPAISATFPFGTKVIPTVENKGGLSTFDVNSNVMLPFTRMRPRVCSADSVTSRVEYDAKIVFSAPQGTTPASGYTLTLGTGDYVGCTVTFTNLLAHACTVRQSDGTTTLFSVPAGKTMSAMWGGSSWLWTTAGSVTAGDPTPVSSAAVQSAVDQKQLLPAALVLEINSVSSTTHTVTMGNVSWLDGSIAVPYKDWYYVQARVSIGNLVGADIQVNQQMQISISLNRTFYTGLLSVLFSGRTEVFLSYGENLSNFWIKNLSSSIVPWDNGNHPLLITISGWVRR